MDNTPRTFFITFVGSPMDTRPTQKLDHAAYFARSHDPDASAALRAWLEARGPVYRSGRPDMATDQRTWLESD